MFAAQRRCAERGFTLVELMVAAAVLAIGLTGGIAAVLGATRLDRRHNAKAAAHAVAGELARAIEAWDFNDPRLAYVHTYTGAEFAAPKVVTFKVTGNVVNETLSAVPDHQESECGLGFCGRDLARANTESPGKTFLYRRYWNVTPDPANPNLKLVAVHVTYSQANDDRAVTTVVTAVANRQALQESVLKDQFTGGP